MNIPLNKMSNDLPFKFMKQTQNILNFESIAMIRLLLDRLSNVDGVRREKETISSHAQTNIGILLMVSITFCD